MVTPHQEVLVQCTMMGCLGRVELTIVYQVASRKAAIPPNSIMTGRVNQHLQLVTLPAPKPSLDADSRTLAVLHSSGCK